MAAGIFVLPDMHGQTYAKHVDSIINIHQYVALNARENLPGALRDLIGCAANNNRVGADDGRCHGEPSDVNASQFRATRHRKDLMVSCLLFFNLSVPRLLYMMTYRQIDAAPVELCVLLRV
ncbi:hypothetical protein CRI94_06635 [Longibacter salinarum]|uniref:Uncharacterized protein n=1 Tax=Longibacter salinarum TaxID=1850348 RepID=A0A2A8CYH7_9BACT|nr:hypothetical protein CRI94_06635 [Longibacter salinarum]